MSIAEVVFVLGPPGAGKGTQCTRIKDSFGYIHLSAGDLLRAEQKAGSEDGELIKDFIKEGKIVPIEITIRLLEKAVVSAGATKVLIDGFPRNKENLDGWEKEMVETGKMHTKFMLYFECAEEECLSRAMGRNQNRADDNVESFKKRIATYTSSTVLVLEEFNTRGLLRKVDANGSPDQVWDLTRQLFLTEGDTPLLANFMAPIPNIGEISAPTPTPLPNLDEISAPALPLFNASLSVDPSGPEQESVVLSLGEGEGEEEEEEEYSGILSLCNIL
ncbi:UMP-CMP kinase-like isoform X1 [Bolinopsis microptera]|uniref:UMP-CMP kinase-like isoform X1 n=1 Tax=Bolinopsis microptera TaxID=2820187 RepID=UPI003078AF60